MENYWDAITLLLKDTLGSGVEILELGLPIIQQYDPFILKQ